MIKEIQKNIVELGDQLLAWRDTDIADGEWQGTQLKTKADNEAHRILSDSLTTIDNNIPIISEEDLGSQGIERPDQYWLIDPIDGTASYSHGFSGFVSQLALMEEHVPVLSIIYAPALELLYTAEKNKGAQLNGNSIAKVDNSTKKILIDNYPEPRGIANKVYYDLHYDEYIECGSLGLKICRIADGTATMFVKDVIVKDWDIAPAHLILEEVGGKVFDLNANEITYTGNYNINGLIVAANQQLVDELVSYTQINLLGVST